MAADRLTLIQFKDNLDASENFGAVDIPISSFEAETNLEFAINLSYLPVSSTMEKKPIKVNTQF